MAKEHLQTDELAKLYEEACRPGIPRPITANIHPHLAACSLCRERFEEQAFLDRQLEEIHSSKPALRQSDCPEPALWREVATGVTAPEQTLFLVHHASRCDHCGTLLREAVADLNGENTPADEELIAALKSAQPEWQRSLAQRITGTVIPQPVPWWRVWLTVPRLATVGAAVLAVAALGYLGVVQQRQPQTAGRLLASAYSEQRTMELRIAGAAYAPLRVQRGPAASFSERSAALLKAESIIADQLPSHPSDPAWLQAKAQADLLEGKYDAAVESLKRALELAPKTPGLLTDLATAYFQRARSEDRPEDYGAAFEHLSQVLASDPDNAVALYNRAIVGEQQFLYHQALEDWEHYLKVDPRSEWAEEARSRADALRAKLKKQENRSSLLKPDQIASRATDTSLGAEVDPRVEEYLQEAVRAWLPQAFPEQRAPARGVAVAADPQAARALFFLADLTARQHNDRWLTDLLEGSSAANFPQAVEVLARAYKGNDAGEFDISRLQGSRAEQLFRSSGNMAGALRAQFEQVFSEQFLRRTEECRREASAALTEAEKYSYPWLDAQLGLERGVCSGIMGDLGADQMTVQRALTRAQQSSYGGLYLRALGFLADDKFETGDPNGAGRLVGTGLTRWWLGQFPTARAYNFYVFLADNAEAAGRPNLQLALWNESIALVNSDDDLLLRAGAHSQAAHAAAAARQPQVAAQHYAEAAQLYALVPQSEAVRALRLHDAIRAAQLESRQGHFDNALSQLTRIQSEIRQPSDNYHALMFYSTLGQLQLRRQHETEAEQALRPALALAEQNLASLSSEAERANWSRDTAPVYLAMAEAELMQGRAQESLDVFEWYMGASERAGTGSADTHRRNASPYSSGPDPSWLASRLPLLSKETVVAYGALPDGVAIWVYDDRGVNAHWIPKSSHDLEELAARFYELSSDPRTELSAVRRDARSLYAALVAPVEEKLTSDRILVIEADGWLAQVPFEALLDSGSHYLVERGPIVHSRGQYAEALLHADSTISSDLPALIVGSTVGSQSNDLIPLPNVAAEAETVANDFHSSRVLKGREATLSLVKRELPKAAVFHFAGHSLATPQKAGLLLEGQDAQKGAPSLLDASVLQQLKLPNMQLAVLSACSTEGGGAGSRGFNNIAEAFQRSGVPHVVASRWAVDSVETRIFVEDFYRGLLSGQSVSGAIQLTSRKMLSDPRTAHPYYWSAFAAYGRP